MKFIDNGMAELIHRGVLPEILEEFDVNADELKYLYPKGYDYLGLKSNVNAKGVLIIENVLDNEKLQSLLDKLTFEEQNQIFIFSMHIMLSQSAVEKLIEANNINKIYTTNSNPCLVESDRIAIQEL